MSRVTSIHVYAIFRVYTWRIVFAGATKGNLHGARFHLSSSSPSSSFALAFTLPSLQVRSSAGGRYCVTMYTTGQTSTVLRATDSGANVIIFRNLLSRCSPLWSRRWCRSVLPGVYFPGSSPTDADIVIFCLHVAEFFYMRIRAIVKFLYPCMDPDICAKRGKKEIMKSVHIIK